MPPPPNCNNDPVASDRYCSQSDIHRDLSALFMAYIDAYLFVDKTLKPSMLTPFSLCQSLFANVEIRKLLNSSLDDEDTGMGDLEDDIEDIIAHGKKFAALINRGESAITGRTVNWKKSRTGMRMTTKRKLHPRIQRSVRGMKRSTRR